MSEPSSVDVDEELGPHILFLCTGNAARSVMAGAVLSAVAPTARITTAGTHVIDGLPMSRRTRNALDAIGLQAPSHRSRQLWDSHLADVDLVVGLATEHVSYVRRTHPEAAARTATLRRLCRDLSPGPAPLVERLAALDLAGVQLGGWEDVDDPAGGEDDTFVACAREVDRLVRELAARMA